MQTSPLNKKGQRAFTLLELLVVVAIIGILVGILFSGYNAVMNNSRKTQATADARNLMLGVLSYQAEYGKLPLNPDQIGGATASGKDTVYGDPGRSTLYRSYLLMAILRAKTEPKYNSNNELNPSQTVYFDAPFVKDPTDPRRGLLRTAYNDGNYVMPAGCLVDPWGSEYIVWLDANKDGDLNEATKWFYPNYPKDQGPKGRVQVGSMGADGTFGKDGIINGSDDVIMAQ